MNIEMSIGYMKIGGHIDATGSAAGWHILNKSEIPAWWLEKNAEIVQCYGNHDRLGNENLRLALNTLVTHGMNKARAIAWIEDEIAVRKEWAKEGSDYSVELAFYGDMLRYVEMVE
jgi:hypothetical protein